VTPDPTIYRIIQRNHVAQWSDALQQAVPGWDLRVQWLSTGTILPVFVPDTVYTPENIDTMIRAAGAVDERVHALGG
jgi:hypothetical protein